VGKFLIVLGVFISGCGGAPTVNLRPVVVESRRPELRELPPDVALEALPEGIPSHPPENYVQPLEYGQCVVADGSVVSEGPCPDVSGILVSEARAARDAMYRIRYVELRRVFEADRRVWSAHRELYEAQIVEYRQELIRLQPGWWDEHKGEILAVVGFVTGAVLTVIVTYAVTQASE